MKLKGFIELTEYSTKKKILININEIQLVTTDKKVHFFNVYTNVCEPYEDIIKMIKENN